MKKDLKFSFKIYLILLFSFNLMVGQTKLDQFDITDDNKLIALCFYNDTLVRFIDNATSKSYLLKPRIGNIKKLNISDDNKQIVMLSDQNKLAVFSIENLSFTFSLDNITDAVQKGNTLYTSGNDGVVSVFDFPSMKLLKKLSTHENAINSICINKNQNEILVGGKDGWLKIIDLNKSTIKTETLLLNYEEPLQVYYDSDNKIYVRYLRNKYSMVYIEFSPNLKNKKTIDLSGPYTWTSPLAVNKFLMKERYSPEINATFNIVKLKPKKSTIPENYSFLGFATVRKENLIYVNEDVDSLTYNASVINIEQNKKLNLQEGPSFPDLKINGLNSTFTFKIDGEVIPVYNKTKVTTIANEHSIKLHTSLADLFKKNKLVTKNNEVELLVQQGYASPIKDLLISHDSKVVITLSESPVLKFWDAKTNFLIKEMKLGNYEAFKMSIHPKLPLLAVIDVNLQLFIIDLEDYTIIKSERFSQKGYFDFDEGQLANELNQNFHLWFDEYGTYLHFNNLAEIQDEEKNMEGDGASYAFHINMFDVLDNRKIENNKFNYDQLTNLNYDLEQNGSLTKVISDNGPVNKLYYFKSSNFAAYSGIRIYLEGKSAIKDTIYSTQKLETKNYAITNAYPDETNPKDTSIYLEYKGCDCGGYSTLKSQVYFDSLKTIRAQNWEKKDTVIYIPYSEIFEYTPLFYNPDKTIGIVWAGSKEGDVYLYDFVTKEKFHNIPNASPLMKFTEDGKYFYTTDFLVRLADRKLIKFDSLYAPKKINNGSDFELFKGKYYYFELEQKFVFWKSNGDNVMVEYDLKTNKAKQHVFTKVRVGDVQTSPTHAQVYLNHLNSISKLDIEKLHSFHYYINYSDNIFKITPSADKKQLAAKEGIEFDFYEKGNYQRAANNFLDFEFVQVKQKQTEYGISAFRTTTPAELSFPDLNLWVNEQPFSDSIYIAGMENKPLLSEAQRKAFLVTEKQRNNFLNEKVFIRADMRMPYEYRYLNQFGINTNDMSVYSTVSYDSSKFAIVNESFGIIAKDALTNKLIRNFEAQPVPHFYFHFTPDNKKILSYGVDGAIRLWDTESKDGKPVLTYLESENNHLFYTPDYYYKTSSRSMNFIKFRKDGKVYNIEQFDLKFNRPDILLKRLNNHDSILIQTYHKAYLKRLKKMNFTEDMLKDDIHLPEMKINNLEELPDVTDSLSLMLDINANDSKYKLDRINIYINGVSIYGLNGIDLRKENTQSSRKKISINLVKGLNKIEVSVLNQIGAESYFETVYITRNADNEKSDLYLITIGAGKYSDQRFNLTYAAKDAIDIKELFEKDNSALYKNVFAWSLINEEVTTENIFKLKEKLAKAKRDDIVIITIAGHGVLDKNMDYYLATHEMDFSEPSNKGLPYEQFESLLDGLEAINKVMLIDACHSGELDKDEMQLSVAKNSISENITFRSAGVTVGKNKMGLQNVSEIMSELFADLRKGTGATVISSAGGAEYAMESDQWKNGLFTYCFLNGLKNKESDLNNDGKIMLSELQSYLRSNVTKLSGGAQQPTSRIENTNIDFQIW